MSFNYEKTYERLKKFEIQDILKSIPYDEFGKRIKDIPMKREFLGFLISMGSMRYRTFKKSGHICVKCGLKGQYFILERNRNGKSIKPHFNLYGVDEAGIEVMLTKDHIIPRSKGGSNSITNMQTMCARCNLLKGDKLEQYE